MSLNCQYYSDSLNRNNSTFLFLVVNQKEYLYGIYKKRATFESYCSRKSLITLYLRCSSSFCALQAIDATQNIVHESIEKMVRFNCMNLWFYLEHFCGYLRWLVFLDNLTHFYNTSYLTIHARPMLHTLLLLTHYYHILGVHRQ